MITEPNAAAASAEGGNILHSLLIDLAPEAVPGWAVMLTSASIGVGVLVGFVSIIAMASVWCERKVSGHIQCRYGPMYVGGFHGWAQSLADGVKLLMKEDLIPLGADKVLFMLAPALVLGSIFGALVVLPFAPDVYFANPSLGVFLILAMSSLTTIGVVMAGNDVLEIGFGRGVASTFIQHRDVASYTIVEMNPHSVSDHYVPWRQRYPQQDIRLVAGRWQDTLAQLADYDAVFFHAFPMNESEFEQHVLHSATYAEHFFATAAGLLRPGGVFTYMTTEIDSLSRRHQRSLLQHFAEIQLKVVSLSVPDDTRDAWWADSMVIVRAIR